MKKRNSYKKYYKEGYTENLPVSTRYVKKKIKPTANRFIYLKLRK